MATAVSPWHCAQDAVEDRLARRLERVQLGIGIGQRELVPAAIASDRTCTLGEENWVLWKPATSSRKLTGGSTVIPTHELRSAPSAWFCSVSMRPSSW